VIGERLPEAVENRGRRGPVLQLHESRRGIVLGGGPDRRRRRALRDAQEVARRGAVVLGLVRLLGLLVDRRGEVVDERPPAWIVGGRQLEDLGVRGLRGLVVGELERRVRNDRPRRASHCRVG
jgi:hypothetical protein